jgi:hypothetical protein
MMDGSIMEVVKIEKPRSKYMTLENCKDAKSKVNHVIVIYLNSKNLLHIVKFK